MHKAIPTRLQQPKASVEVAPSALVEVTTPLVEEALGRLLQLPKASVAEDLAVAMVVLAVATGGWVDRLGPCRVTLDPQGPSIVTQGQQDPLGVAAGAHQALPLHRRPDGGWTDRLPVSHQRAEGAALAADLAATAAATHPCPDKTLSLLQKRISGSLWLPGGG